MPRRRKINKKTVPLVFVKSPNTDKIYSSPTHGVVYPVTLEAVPVESCPNFTFDKYFDSDLLYNVSREIKSKPFQKHSVQTSSNFKYNSLHFKERTKSLETDNQVNSGDKKQIQKNFERTKSAESIKAIGQPIIKHLSDTKHLVNSNLKIKNSNPIQSNIQLNRQSPTKFLSKIDNTNNIAATNQVNVIVSHNLLNFKNRNSIELDSIGEESISNVTSRTFSVDDSTDSELEPLSPEDNFETVNQANNFSCITDNNYSINTKSSTNKKFISSHRNKNETLVMIDVGSSNQFTNKNSTHIRTNNNISNMHDTWNTTLIPPYNISTPELSLLSTTVIQNLNNNQFNNETSNIKQINIFEQRQPESIILDKITPIKIHSPEKEIVDTPKKIPNETPKPITINNIQIPTNNMQIPSTKCDISTAIDDILPEKNYTQVKKSRNMNKKNLENIYDNNHSFNINRGDNTLNNKNILYNDVPTYIEKDQFNNYSLIHAANTPPPQYGLTFRQKQLQNIFQYS